MPEELNLWQRINSIKSEVGYVKKDSKIEGMGKPIPAVTHDAVASMLHDSMVKYGVLSKTVLKAHRFMTYETTNFKGVTKVHHRLVGEFDVVLINIDNPDQRESYPTIAFSDDSGDKGPGIIASYATKTVHLKAFGLVTGVDDENTRPEKVDKETIEKAAGRLRDAKLAPGKSLKGIAALMGFGEIRDVPAAKSPQLKSHVTRLINARGEK